MESVTSNVVVLPISPERTDFDKACKPCNCGAQPLLTEANGLYYMSCSPCWVRTHKVKSPELARLQWECLMVPLRMSS